MLSSHGGSWVGNGFPVLSKYIFMSSKKLWVCNRMKHKPDNLCSVSVKRARREEPPPTAELTGPRITYSALQISTGTWPQASAGPAEHPDRRARGSRDLPFAARPSPPQTLCCAAQAPRWTAWSLPRDTGTSDFTVSFIFYKASLPKKNQKIFCHLTRSVFKCYLSNTLIMLPLEDLRLFPSTEAGTELPKNKSKKKKKKDWKHCTALLPFDKL